MPRFPFAFYIYLILPLHSPHSKVYNSFNFYIFRSEVPPAVLPSKMSSGCGNCDCADKSQCTKKRNSFGVEIVETTCNMSSYGAEMGENDCKCGPSCTCTGCTCHSA